MERSSPPDAPAPDGAQGAAREPGADREGVRSGARAKTAGEPLSNQDREFLSPARSIVETPPSPIRIGLAIAICLLFTVALAAAVIGRVDIYAEAQGRIQPVGRSKVIQPLDAGRILRLYVRDGARVRAGQLLVELDPTEPAATAAAALQKRGELSAEVARRLRAVSEAKAGRYMAPATPDFPPEAPADLRLRETAVLRADLAQLGGDLDELRGKLAENTAEAHAAQAAVAAHHSTMATLSQRVDIRSSLQRQGWESRTNVLDAQEDLDKERAGLVSAEGQLAQAHAAAATLRSQMQGAVDKFVDDNAQALRDAQNKLDQANQDLIKATDALKHTRLVSPLDGVVQQLAVTTVGQVVTTGQQLMTVVPAKAVLEIEAEIPNKDIGFVRVGQPAVVKVDAFPFSRYGVLSGRVVRVSHDAVTSQEATADADSKLTPINPQSSAASPTPQVKNLVYPVTVRLDRDTIRADGRDVPLSPGMSVTVEVRTGKRRAISYLLSPFVEVTSEAAHER